MVVLGTVDIKHLCTRKAFHVTIVRLPGMLNAVNFHSGPATGYGIRDHIQMLSRLDKDIQYFHQGALRKTNISNFVCPQGVVACIELLQKEI